ncbi:hypothetical protein H6P81_015585 [Aristolochia fimbriata]|uniref:DNA primase n=2 Tax=Magnoliopsida TaxID=3398 RepID=A0AAV7E5X4_ARIFI|nr:hypothetical protein H6P81_015585 [Aristolochia fimbriata]
MFPSSLQKGQHQTALLLEDKRYNFFSVQAFSSPLTFPLQHCNPSSPLLSAVPTKPKHYRPPVKKKEGNAAKYITRTKAIHYLQINLSTFRKLCILKGVFTREPKKKVDGNHKTYYHMKDILFHAHDPLLEKLRITMKKAGTENERDDMLIDECAPEQMQEDSFEEGFNVDYLKVYYGKLFPHAEIFKWMSYGNDGKHLACDQSYFGRREFSFTLDNDVYLRFLSFNSLTDLEKAIKEKCPFKIDIGPVYSVDPAKRHAYAQGANNVFKPVERELVFDIDMSDYDDVRYCCTGADVCLDCWPLMTIAIKVMDTALRDDFGFNHILWVYSGRRGVHCWVCDGRARRLTNEQRTSVVEYFRVYKGNENCDKKVSLPGQALHPFLAKCYTDVLKIFFEEILINRQSLFANEERMDRILNLIPDEAIISDLRNRWHENRRLSTSKEDINKVRWEQLKHLLQSGKHKVQGLRRCVEEIVFSYTYPRLDMEVSKHMNHLLKSPFCVHPKTGRVCIPIDPNCCEDFDPTSVPTLAKLLRQLNLGGPNENIVNEWERTSLSESVRFFQISFLQPLLKTCKEEKESSYNAKIQKSKNSLTW